MDNFTVLPKTFKFRLAIFFFPLAILLRALILIPVVEAEFLCNNGMTNCHFFLFPKAYLLLSPT